MDGDYKMRVSGRAGLKAPAATHLEVVNQLEEIMTNCRIKAGIVFDCAYHLLDGG